MTQINSDLVKQYLEDKATPGVLQVFEHTLECGQESNRGYMGLPGNREEQEEAN